MGITSKLVSTKFWVVILAMGLGSFLLNESKIDGAAWLNVMTTFGLAYLGFDAAREAAKNGHNKPPTPPAVPV